MTKTNEEKIKYPFSHHIIFAMVMNDPILCKELIERILPGRKVKEVVIKEQPSVLTEATLLSGPDAKFVRLDVLFEDGTAWYDIEMQIAPEEALPKRGRYYSSITDTKILKTGAAYEELKPSFIIFLCRFDYYGMGQPIYHFQRWDPELNLPFGDESYIILLNSKCAEDKVPDNLKSLFAYINDSQVTSGDPLIEEIHNRVLALQGNEEVAAIMTMEEEYQMKLGYAERKGLEKGMEQGIEQGIEQGEERINRLNLRLREENRIEDIFKAAEDKAYREQLLEEFGL